MDTYVVAALYKFAQLPTFNIFQPLLAQEGQRLDIKGTLLLAPEGINGTLSGKREALDTFITFLKNLTHLQDLEYKESFTTRHPFFRLKVRLKKEIVTLGQPNVDVTKKVGTYVAAQYWNDLLKDPEVLVIDNRNRYETAMGTFKDAIDPLNDSFGQFPDYVQKNLNPAHHKKIALFCTGGIRCEKSSSYLLGLGFENVYHLKGGILKYLETVPAADSLWQGECFVFDQRVGVQHGLTPGDYQVCFGCRQPLSPDDQQSPHYQEGIHCHHCYADRTVEQQQRAANRHQQILRAKKKGQNHMGKKYFPYQKEEPLDSK